MSQAMPLVDPGTAADISTAALFLWPVVVTGIVAAIRWWDLKSRLAFIALGYLVWVGVGAFVRTFGYAFFWIHSAADTPGGDLLATLMNASISITVFGAILSVGPVLWLAKLLAHSDTATAT
jgi:hypothetical protein